MRAKEVKVYLWITLKAKGDWSQVDLQGSGRCSVLKGYDIVL